MNNVKNGGPIVLAVLLPIVGIIIGLIQYSKGSQYAMQTMTISIASWIFWTLVIIAIGGS